MSEDAAAREDAREEPRVSILDVVVFGPVDAIFAVLRDPVGSATRGRERVEHLARQARTLGELAVRFGAQELRSRTTRPDAPTTTAPRAVSPDAGPPPNEVIADYDSLSASQIVPMLAALSAEERGRVASYEARARGRQTILRRIAQLDEDGG